MRAFLIPILPFLVLPFSASAQLASAQFIAKAHAATAISTKSSVPAPTELRVTHVSLYKNGVGFFEHEGRVTGDQTVRLDLTSAQLNDVLQTLTAVDLGGGHISGANYNSTTPLAQQLDTLPLSLGEQPSEQDLYNTLRGARVEVTGSGAPFTGRILSLEIRTPTPPLQPAQSNDPATSAPAPGQRFLTVISDAGATRTLLLTLNTAVRLLDTALRTDLNTYLQLLDRTRTEGTRHLTLTDHGSGSRLLRLSFLSEVPVWKSTYRLLVTDTPTSGSPQQPAATKSATLQGFSVVDNTTGEDWKDVQLSLIAGNPQSFLQPLAQPIYDRRPEIPIAENAQTMPQTHDSAIGTPTVVPNSASANLSSSAGGNPSSLFGSPTGTGDATAPGTGGNVGGGLASARGLNMIKDNGPPPPPMPYETIARNSTVANTTTAAFDDFFAYNLTDPVTIPRNGSALVPILQTEVPTERVTLWSATPPAPLRALWLDNTSQLTLDRGSFAVIENGAFAGQGLLEPVHPGERRLLSYATDQAIRVIPGDRQDTRRVTSFSVVKGVLRAANTEVDTVDYTVSNAAPDTRTVVVEEPRRPEWTLDTDTQPSETTPTAYRFRLVVAPGKPVALHITQRHILDQYFQLNSFAEDQLTLYLHQNGANPALLAQLEPVLAAKRTLSDLDTRILETRAKINGIGDDQKRLRDNLAALKNSPEERALVRRYTTELNAQEDALASLRRDLVALQQQRTAAAEELSIRINSLQIGVTDSL